VPATVAHRRFTFNYGSTHPAEGRRDKLVPFDRNSASAAIFLSRTGVTAVDSS
jgi:hypothetical protein